MKKLFFLLFATTAFIACDKDDNSSTFQQGEYAGTLIVTDNTQAPATEAEFEDIHYILTQGEDGLLSLTMSNIRFTTSMPMALTIVIPKLRLENKMLISTQNPIIPQMGGKDQPAFEIPEFTGRVDNNKLEVTFTCVANNPLGPTRPLELNHQARFSGEIAK